MQSHPTNRKKMFAPPHARAALALAAGLAASLTTPTRADVYGYDHGPNNRLWGVSSMPDFDQRRATQQNPFVLGLHGDGAMFCAPTATSNIAAYTTWRGLGPWSQSMDWASPDPNVYYNATIHIATMGEAMGTDDTTTTAGMFDGANSTFSGIPFDVLCLQLVSGNSFPWSPTSQDIISYGFQGGLMAMCYGRYDHHTNADGITVLDQRHTGHCVTPTGVWFRPGHNPRMIWRNPGTGGNSELTQSGFATDAYDVADWWVRQHDTEFYASVIQSFPADGRLRIIDTLVVVLPAWMLVDPPIQGYIQIYQQPVHPASGTPIGPIVNPIDPPVAPTWNPLDFAARPDRQVIACIETPPPTEPPGTPSRLIVHKTLDGGGIAGQVTLLNPKAMTYSRLMELYVIDGASLIRYWTGPEGITELERITLPPGAAPVAVSYDDLSDTVLVLSAADRTVYRYDHVLGFALRPIPIPAGGGSPDILTIGAGAGFSLFVSRQDADLWIAGERAGAVGRFRFDTASASYHPLQIIQTPTLHPTDVQLDNAGRLLVASGGQILEYTPDQGGVYQAVGATEHLYADFHPTRHFELTLSRSNRLVPAAEEPQWVFELIPDELGGTETPDCRADFNHDGRVDSSDFFDFLNAFLAGYFTGDFDYNGTINSQDFFAFLTAFFGGC